MWPAVTVDLIPLEYAPLSAHAYTRKHLHEVSMPYQTLHYHGRHKCCSISQLWLCASQIDLREVKLCMKLGSTGRLLLQDWDYLYSSPVIQITVYRHCSSGDSCPLSNLLTELTIKCDWPLVKLKLIAVDLVIVTVTSVCDYNRINLSILQRRQTLLPKKDILTTR